MPDFRVVIFTQAIDHGEGNYEGSFPDERYGDKLAVYIKANRLGTVVKAPTGISPNTGNHVTAYLWRLSDKGLYKWAKSQGMKHIKRRPRKDDRY